ncbi:MAG TPA: hypothetical protein VGC60_16720 [Pyrinomonadaceae bacterium]|jgi:hypothetical protein
MFDLYGPNSLRVKAYIKAIAEMSEQEFANIDRLNLDSDRLIAVFQKALSFKNERLPQTENASRDATLAALHKGTTNQIVFVSLVASVLVLEDRLNRDEQVFLHLFVIDPRVPLRRLYTEHKKEDFAIEQFCEHLSRIDDENAYIKVRPDARGQIGEGLPDFILHRSGQDFTIEHTYINSYENQVLYEHLYSKYFKPLNIEERIREAFPNKLIDISIPIDAFKRESEARKFDFNQFIENLINAVTRTPETYNPSTGKRFEFPSTRFPVFISKCKGFGVTFVVQIVPASSEQVREHLVAEIKRAVSRKRKKLAVAQTRGENTILLLDTDDYALINYEILAHAFAAAVGTDQSQFQGIDDVYIQHRGGGCWIFPVKLGEQLYPHLPEFEEYWKKQAQLLGVRLGGE